MEQGTSSLPWPVPRGHGAGGGGGEVATKGSCQLNSSVQLGQILVVTFCYYSYYVYSFLSSPQSSQTQDEGDPTWTSGLGVVTLSHCFSIS